MGGYLLCALWKNNCVVTCFGHTYSNPMKTLRFKKQYNGQREACGAHVCKHEVFELSVFVGGLHLTFLRNSLNCLGSVSTKRDKETKDGKESSSFHKVVYYLSKKCFLDIRMKPHNLWFDWH